MKRETYIDNNGFERYEDNCKIVVKKEYTKEEKEVAGELYRTFNIKSNILDNS